MTADEPASVRTRKGVAMLATTKRARRRRFALAAGATVFASSAAVVGVASSAQAAGSWQIGGGQSVAVPTYFFGKTVICVTNLSPNYSSFRATSLSTVVSASLSPWGQDCTTLNRAWVGAYVRVLNQGG